MFKFESLEVWQDALLYADRVHSISESLPPTENFNLRSQLVRAATSVALNIAEGSTGQTNTEQARFLGLAIRSVIETVACIQLIRRRGYLQDELTLDAAYRDAHRLATRLQAFRRSLDPDRRWVREESESYLVTPDTGEPSDERCY